MCNAGLITLKKKEMHSPWYKDYIPVVLYVYCLSDAYDDDDLDACANAHGHGEL
jgi:hypothetical protein